jgi:hypothetical protein
LTTCGQEFEDWSADYRVFSRERLPIEEIFSVVRRAVLQRLAPQGPLTVAIDDTLLRKTGIRIPGVGWRRDPLGPQFQTNFVRAQRALQLSADLPLTAGGHRMVPIGFYHAPTPIKPSRKADPAALAQYRQDARQSRISLLASRQIVSLRQRMDADGAAHRPLHICVDGGYTNGTVLKSLPANTVLIGRIRQDAKLYFLPMETSAPKAPGRPRHYGDLAPTPNQLRTNDTAPWQSVDIELAGNTHALRVKVSRNLLWRTAGLQHVLQLVVIAPLGYRLRKGSKLLYRRPAFLICTDPQLDLHAVLQQYVHRWDIEVNFREEKTLLGVGQAQVRNPHSVQQVPALQVASYAMLLLSMSHLSMAGQDTDSIPPAKWAAPQKPSRPSTQAAINHLRAEVWGKALGLTNFSDLMIGVPPVASPEKFAPHLPSAVLYAYN